MSPSEWSMKAAGARATISFTWELFHILFNAVLLTGKLNRKRLGDFFIAFKFITQGSKKWKFPLVTLTVVSRWQWYQDVCNYTHTRAVKAHERHCKSILCYRPSLHGTNQWPSSGFVQFYLSLSASLISHWLHQPNQPHWWVASELCHNELGAVWYRPYPDTWKCIVYCRTHPSGSHDQYMWYRISSSHEQDCRVCDPCLCSQAWIWPLRWCLQVSEVPIPSQQIEKD